MTHFLVSSVVGFSLVEQSSMYASTRPPKVIVGSVADEERNCFSNSLASRCVANPLLHFLTLFPSQSV